MPEKTIKRRLTEAGARELADDDGPIFSTVAKLVDALQRAVPHSRDLELRDEALRLGRELLRGTKYEGAPMIEPQVIELWPSGHVANARPECRRRALVRNPHQVRAGGARARAAERDDREGLPR